MSRPPGASHVRIPLHYRLSLAVIVLVAAACTLLYFYVPGRLHRQSIEALEDKAITIGRITAYSAVPAVLFGDSVDIAEAIASAGEDPDLVLISVADAAGLTLGTHGETGTGDEVLRKQVPIRHDGEVIGTVSVTMSTHRMMEGVAASQVRVALVALLLFVVGVASALSLARLVTRPLALVAATARGIAEGAGMTRVDVTSADEVGDLAKAFNMMIDRLEAAQDELSRTNASLEQRVDERTVELRNEVRERQRAEVQLRASEQRFRTVFESAGIGIVVMDVQGVVIEANRSIQTLLAPNQLLGQAITDLLDQPSRDRFNVGRAAVTGGDARSDQAELHVIGGTNLMCTLSAVRDASSALYFIALLQDVTEQRELETKFRESQKLEAIGRLAGGIAHDFNNLLTTINGVSDLLLASPLNDATRHDIEEIRTAGTRAGQLTRQLLAFSRRQVLQAQVVQLNDVISDTARMLHRIIGETIDLRLDLDPHLPPVLADSGQVVQVIMNLVVNSRDAMPHGGAIDVVTSTVDVDDAMAARLSLPGPGPHVQLTVRDDGSGMEESTIAHAFEPFFTTKPVGRGTGLGLATVYGIVRQSRGMISVTSKVGEGTTFRILLPAVEPEPAVATTTRTEVIAPHAHSAATILVVEDEPNVRSLIVRVLARRGFRILQAKDGAEALALVRALDEPIDLLVTDVIMPQLSGPGLAKILRAQDPDLRVIFVSGYTPDDLRNEVIQDADAFIEKPMSPAGLLRTIDEVLARRSSCSLTGVERC